MGIPARSEPAPSTTPPKTYRVELRCQGRVVMLGELVDVPGHFRSLDPYLGRVLHCGLRGELALVDPLTGATIARRTVRPPHPRRPPTES